YIELDALYDKIKGHVEECAAPLKPKEVFELLRMIYEENYESGDTVDDDDDNDDEHNH
ncbi:5486_t:CDS:2, partial [Entrophospora sp. SA101]